jgi:hypothetical protein
MENPLMVGDYGVEEWKDGNGTYILFIFLPFSIVYLFLFSLPLPFSVSHSFPAKLKCQLWQCERWKM